NIGSPFFPIKRQPSGELLLDLTYKTDGQLGAIYAGDIGKWALVAFKDPKTWVVIPKDKDMKVVTEWVTPREIAKIIEEELGEKNGDQRGRRREVESDEARGSRLRGALAQL
ncbi:13699_t:CDS:2, partial [Acaulospora colombiana]